MVPFWVKRSIRIPGAVCLIFLAGCESGDEPKHAPFEETHFESDTIYVTNEFPEFSSPIIPKTLESLGLCTRVDSLIGERKSVCSSELFRVFPLEETVNYEKGFMVDTRMGVLAGSTTKALLVFVNIKGELKMMNFLKGKLLEFRTTKTGYFNIVMQYRDSRLPGYVTIEHEWDSERQTYLPANVMEINNHFVREIYRDSINKVYLTEFAWGY